MHAWRSVHTDGSLMRSPVRCIRACAGRAQGRGRQGGAAQAQVWARGREAHCHFRRIPAPGPRGGQRGWGACSGFSPAVPTPAHGGLRWLRRWSPWQAPCTLNISQRRLSEGLFVTASKLRGVNFKGQLMDCAWCRELLACMCASRTLRARDIQDACTQATATAWSSTGTCARRWSRRLPRSCRSTSPATATCCPRWAAQADQSMLANDAAHTPGQLQEHM